MSTFKKRISDLTDEYIKKTDEIMYPLRTTKQRSIIRIRRMVRNLIITRGIK